MRVIVIGSGIAGLSAAIALRKSGSKYSGGGGSSSASETNSWSDGADEVAGGAGSGTDSSTVLFFATQTGNHKTADYSLHRTESYTYTAVSSGSDDGTTDLLDGSTNTNAGSGNSTRIESGTATTDESGNDATTDYDRYVTATFTATIAQTRLRFGDVEGALVVAEKFKNASDRNHLLFSLAGMQAEAGDIPGARKTAATITDHDQRDGAIEAIGRAEARAGDLEAAVRIADGLKHQPLSRAGVLAEIALAQAKAKDRKAAAASLAESLRLSVATLADAGQRESARAEASVKQAMIGDIEGALKAATALDADNRSDALGRIALEQVKQGDLPRAVKTLGDIKDVGIRARAYLDFAHAQSIKKDRVGAEKTLATASDLAAALPAAERAELLDEIRAVRASLLLAGRDVKGALEAAGTVEDGRARWRILLEVGRAQMEAGDQKAARATFGRAMKATVDYLEGRMNEGGVITLVPAWALVKGSILRQVTAATTTAGGEEEARAYAAGQKSPFVRVMAELGIAEGVYAQGKEEKKPAR